MTTRKTLIHGCSIVALAAAGAIPALVACGGASSGAAGATAPSSSYGAQGTMPGQQGYPTQPQGYPTQPQGYPTQQQGAYPTQQQGAYPTQGAVGQPQQGAYPAQPTPGAAPTSTTAPLSTVSTTDPNSLAAIFAQAAAAGQAMLGGQAGSPGAITGDPVQAGITLSAAKHAKGMQPEGQMATGQLQEGGHLEFMVPMAPGKCYTIIGFGVGIKNLDLNLLAPPFYNIMAGQDTTDDNMPVVGSTPNPMCPIIPLQMTYKVDITARTGSGNAGVQVYSKAK